jgi:hypothetical protein
MRRDGTGRLAGSVSAACAFLPSGTHPQAGVALLHQHRPSLGAAVEMLYSLCKEHFTRFFFLSKNVATST